MLNSWLLAILLIGFNVAIRLLFKSIGDSRRLKELESQRLWAELNYLKAQVNPHFFMNTLNNIHALIDIDVEQAKDTVIELSRIMRYVLYEADSAFVPLKKRSNSSKITLP
jgi:Putative regulator of cell autolysis